MMLIILLRYGRVLGFDRIVIFVFRLLEMRMPRSSSFSVRDILDMKGGGGAGGGGGGESGGSASVMTSLTSTNLPTETTDIYSNPNAAAAAAAAHQRFHGTLS